MRVSYESLPISVIRRDFSKWSAMVSGCLQGGARARRLSSPRYGELHTRLIKQCYLHIQSDRASERELFQQLLTFVKPWQSLETLRGAPPHLLAGLVQQCRILEQDLGLLPGQRRLWPSGWIIGGLLVAIGIGIVYSVSHYVDGPQMGLWAECRLAFLRLKVKVSRLNVGEKSALVALAAVAVGVWMSWTTNRS